MIATTIIFTPTIIVMGLMIQFHIRKKRWVPLITIPFIVMVCIFHCFMLTKEWVYGDMLSEELMQTRNILVSLVFPAAYVLLCSKSGEDWKTSITAMLIALAGLNFIDGVTICLDSIPTIPAPTDDRIHVMLGGSQLFSIRILEFVVLIQIIWITTKWIRFHSRMTNEGLHFSKHSKQMAYIFVAMFVIVVISIVLPNSIWRIPWLLHLLFFLPMSLGISALELMISWGWILTPILDTNGEPAVNTVSIDFEQLQRNIRDEVEKKKLFLRSDLKLEDLAHLLNTNRSYISHAVNQMAECNFNTYLNRLRIEEATKIILADPSINLEVVAQRSGFSSGSVFTKTFKKETGVNPSELKKKK